MVIFGSKRLEKYTIRQYPKGSWSGATIRQSILEDKNYDIEKKEDIL